jgi:hypothetical protein
MKFCGLSAPVAIGFALLSQLFHYGADEFLGIVNGLEHNLHVSGRLAGIAIAPAIDAMLPHEDERVGEHVHGDREASSRDAHHELVLFELVVLFIEDGHSLLTAEDAEDAGIKDY